MKCDKGGGGTFFLKIAWCHLWTTPQTAAKSVECSLFMCESSYCYKRILAIAILSLGPSVTRVDQSKMVQARITKSSLSAAWKTLVQEP